MSKSATGTWPANIMRPNCSQCKNPIEWFTFEEASKHVDLRNFMVQVLTHMGPIDSATPVEVWRCTNPICREYGILL